uniref:Uncharacterized protein n=1 Tax=Plectus sambesii TaxID=2011161 RepID=A0A914USH7_9BILA
MSRINLEHPSQLPVAAWGSDKESEARGFCADRAALFDVDSAPGAGVFATTTARFVSIFIRPRQSFHSISRAVIDRPGKSAHLHNRPVGPPRETQQQAAGLLILYTFTRIHSSLRPNQTAQAVVVISSTSTPLVRNKSTTSHLGGHAHHQPHGEQQRRAARGGHHIHRRRTHGNDSDADHCDYEEEGAHRNNGNNKSGPVGPTDHMGKKSASASLLASYGQPLRAINPRARKRAVCFGPFGGGHAGRSLGTPRLAHHRRPRHLPHSSVICFAVGGRWMDGGAIRGLSGSAVDQ